MCVSALSFSRISSQRASIWSLEIQNSWVWEKERRRMERERILPQHFVYVRSSHGQQQLCSRWKCDHSSDRLSACKCCFDLHDCSLSLFLSPSCAIVFFSFFFFHYREIDRSHQSSRFIYERAHYRRTLEQPNCTDYINCCATLERENLFSSVEYKSRGNVVISRARDREKL